jgi:flagellar basal body P-ring protein FlgI
VNQKLKKTMDTIDKTRMQIEQLQARMQELEEARIALENEEFITAVRAAGLTPDQLAMVLQRFQGGEHDENL